MKRSLVLFWILAVFATALAFDFAADGGWLRLFEQRLKVTSPQDAVIRTDTVTINNVHVDTLELAAALDTVVAQWGVLTFIVGDNTDTVRYVFAVAPTGDTLFLSAPLEDSTAANDSAIVEFYSDDLVVDTTEGRVFKGHEVGTCRFHGLTARIREVNHSDSCGVIIVVRNRLHDLGDWVTFLTATLDSSYTDTTIVWADSLADGTLPGDQWQVLVIAADSVGGVANRVFSFKPEVFLQCSK